MPHSQKTFTRTSFSQQNSPPQNSSLAYCTLSLELIRLLRLTLSKSNKTPRHNDKIFLHNPLSGRQTNKPEPALRWGPLSRPIPPYPRAHAPTRLPVLSCPRRLGPRHARKVRTERTRSDSAFQEGRWMIGREDHSMKPPSKEWEVTIGTRVHSQRKLLWVLYTIAGC